MAQYSAADNPLFIAEAGFRAGDAFLALGRFGGFGYRAFGLEDGRLLNGDERQQVLQGDRISASRIRLLEAAQD